MRSMNEPDKPLSEMKPEPVSHHTDNIDLNLSGIKSNLNYANSNLNILTEGTVVIKRSVDTLHWLSFINICISAVTCWMLYNLL